MSSLAGPHCTAAESYKFISRDGPQQQPPCGLVWVVYPSLWTLLVSVLGQTFPTIEVFCCNDQLIPQPYKLVEFYFSNCMIMDRAKVSVVIFLVHFVFHNRVVRIIFGPRKSIKSVLVFSKVHIVGSSEIVQGGSSVATMRFCLWDGTLVVEKNWFTFEKES